MRHRKYVLMIVVFLAGMVWLYFGSSPRVELTAGEDSKAYLEAFSPDYETARAKFREAASSAGATTETHQIEAKGAKGEVLTIDVARVGSDSPEWTVVVSSGIHGVEGPFGSAVQVAWLRTFAEEGSALRDGAMVLIHTLNPYGFSWSRRADENNIDLNRNYRRAGLPYETNAVYTALDGFLNPPSPPSPYEPFKLKALWYIWSYGGTDALKAAIAVGQYDFPKGLFYGGKEPAQSTRLVRANFARWSGNAPHIVHLDLHTGLGKYGGYKALVLPREDTPEFEWYRHHFGGATESMQKEKDATAYPATGVLIDWLAHRTNSTEYRGVIAEFGTYSPIEVLGALRSENRAHFYSTPDKTAYQKAKLRLRDYFRPQDPEWRRQGVHDALHMIQTAVSAARALSTGSGKTGINEPQ